MPSVERSHGIIPQTLRNAPEQPISGVLKPESLAFIPKEQRFTALGMWSLISGFVKQMETVPPKVRQKIDPTTFPMVSVLNEISTYMEPRRTIQDEKEAFEQIKEVVTSKKFIEYYPILGEMAERWTLADYHAVGNHALSAYGFDTEPNKNNP